MKFSHAVSPLMGAAAASTSEREAGFRDRAEGS